MNTKLTDMKKEILKKHLLTAKFIGKKNDPKEIDEVINSSDMEFIYNAMQEYHEVKLEDIGNELPLGTEVGASIHQRVKDLAKAWLWQIERITELEQQLQDKDRELKEARLNCERYCFKDGI